MNLNSYDLKDFLDEKVITFNQPSFIESDPISIPHQYSLKEDIEIAGFLTAVISWGNRKSILRSASRMMEIMGNSPYEFVMNFNEDELKIPPDFVHRTFNSVDLSYFLKALRHIYSQHSGLEGVFSNFKIKTSLQPAIHKLHNIFFELPHEKRTEKHISDPFNGSSAKRINMFLRWMVRKDKCGVDFGIWDSVSPSILSCPLDVHSGNVARKLGILKRIQNDALAVSELDSVLRSFDKNDPVKYDFALFGLGAMEKF